MHIAVFSTKKYERPFLDEAAASCGQTLFYLEPRLTPETAALGFGYPAVCAFVNDVLNATVLERLAAKGLKYVALRSAGFNHVDLPMAERLGLTVVRVPAYSPHAVAEHTVALILGLNRKLHRAYNRVRDGNFFLGGLLGFDLHGRTAGVIGTGKIGAIVAKILHGIGCRVLLYDVQPNPDCQGIGEYVSLAEIYRQSTVITLHCPLVPQTFHLINDQAIAQMQPGVMIINTSRGALVDTSAVIRGLKSGQIGHLGIDVYEEEADLFFDDLSGDVLQDDVFARLLTFPNVLVTGHQAFFTREALKAICDTTLSNLQQEEQGIDCGNRVSAAGVAKR
jgi:D-lactate dehydrogenase